MKSKKFSVSVVCNIILLILCVLLIYKGGFISKLKNDMLGSKEKSPTSNYIYVVRNDMFKIMPATKNTIVFVGDSLTDYCNWNELYQNETIINRGIAGDTTTGVLQRINEIVNQKPNKIFLMIGINDIISGVNSKTIVTNYQNILKTINSQDANCKVYVESILPVVENKIAAKNSVIANINSQVKTIAENMSYTYIDLYSKFLDNNQQLKLNYTDEGLHLLGDGYILWKNNIDQYVS